MNERYKENTVGTNSAQTNGSIALFTLERDIRMSGYGMVHSAAFGCNALRYYYGGRYTDPPGGGSGAPLPSLTFAPVVISQGTGTEPDSIALMSSTSPYRFSPATLTAAMASPSSPLSLDDTTGFAQNDIIVVAQGTLCAMMQISAVQSAGLLLQHEEGSLTRFNPPSSGNSLPTFSAGALVFDLGSAWVRNYTLANNSLTVSDLGVLVSSNPATVIVDEIVDLQAEYGVDDGSNGGTLGDGAVDGYTTSTPASALGWMQVLTVRLAVLARGAYEKPAAGTACTTTTVAPTWANGTRTLTVPDGLPSCYRYRVFETTVPIRNMVWKDA